MQLQIALTVIDAASGRVEDVLVSGDADQRVAALANKLGEYFGHPEPDLSLRVERTGEHLAPEASLAACDLLEGDRLTLSDTRDRSAPRGVVSLRGSKGASPL